MNAPDRAAWERGMEQVQAEAGGAIDLFMIDPDEVPDLVLAATCGDQHAALLLPPFVDTLRSIHGMPRRAPALCGCCPRKLRGTAFTVLLAFPMRADPTCAIGLALCPKCTVDRATIMDKAAIALRRIWPDARPVTIHPTEGRA